MIVAMKLADKGRYAPPPALEPAAQCVAETLAHWPGVHARTHWLLGDEREVDGADFYFGKDELGHIHLDSAAHVLHARSVADALIKAGLGGRFEWSREVVVFEIRNQTDVAHALWLFELSYARRQGLEKSQILARIADYVAAGGRGPRSRRSPRGPRRPRKGARDQESAVER
jgi:hypothetical protein